jgi:hypothetical protein
MKSIRVPVVAAALLAGGLLAAAAWGSELSPGYATPPPTERRIMPRDEMRVDLDVLVDGSPVRVIPYQGRLYLPVPRTGAEYAIRVNNRGPRRIEAVVSVDGLSVINGKPASERSVGYLVNANGSVVIKGWRRDKDTVAAFGFEDRENSYAARTGHRENIGVIGLVAFEEQQEIRAYPLEEPLATFGRAADKGDGKGVGGTGTGWGRDVGSSVIEVPFTRSANKRTVTIYYDTAEALRRISVPVDRIPEDGGYPKPFPVDQDYCPPPPPKR